MLTKQALDDLKFHCEKTLNNTHNISSQTYIEHSTILELIDEYDNMCMLFNDLQNLHNNFFQAWIEITDKIEVPHSINEIVNELKNNILKASED